MKVSELKKIIKEAVREVVREELQTLNENAKQSVKTFAPTPPPPAPPSGNTSQATVIQNILEETAKSGEWKTTLNMNSAHAQPPLQMDGNVDLANGTLPSGEVSMDAIKSMIGGRR